MLTSGISFVNFNKKNKSLRLGRNLQSIINDKNEILNSLSNNYRDSYKKNFVNKYKVFSNYRVIGMGGSILGTRTIYEFLKHKIKKNFLFIDNLQSFKKKNDRTKYLNIVVSKSGNTIETILNSNILINNSQKSIFITENKKSYLNTLAHKLKSDIIHHNNYIGGRYSVLSETGLLPAYLMGINITKLRKNILNHFLKKNKSYLKDSSLQLANFVRKNKVKNIILLNYSPELNRFLYWLQQLIAESLGKNKKGFLPLISKAPTDHHSLLQLYLDGPRDKIFYIFSSELNNKRKIKSTYLSKNFEYLNNKDFGKIKNSQKNALLQTFKKNKIPFREFKIKNFSEHTLGELFSYFMLEIAIIGKLVKINPYDQPAVEEVKLLTKKLLS